MMKLIFVEGVSGVGKSTMVRTLCEELCRMNLSAKAYLEFDYENPIDFYATAYLPCSEFERLCGEHHDHADALRANAIAAGSAWLVRYYNEDEAIYPEPLLSALAQREFCYHPANLVPLEEYTAAYTAVWRNFAASVSDARGFILFDGSLLHHPINDMMRNYHIDNGQALRHIKALLDSLGKTERVILYMKTDDLESQLQAAHRDRGQKPADQNQIRFWIERRKHDLAVLKELQEDIEIFDVSNNGWSAAQKQMLDRIL